MFLLYNLLLTLTAPIWGSWMLWRSWQRKEAPNWNERTGSISIPARGPGARRIWLHAVSVGEVVASIPVLRAIKQLDPEVEIVLSVTTSTGHQTARDRAMEWADFLIYFPIDVARFQLAAMQTIRPQVVATFETELWMNFLWAAKVFDARTLLINGRISDRSFRRARPFRFFFAALLSQVDRCLMQSEADRERIRALGAKDSETFGNAKFDEAAGQTPDVAVWRRELGISIDLPCVVVGSVRAEEFGFLADAMSRVNGTQWVIAPRHVERTGELVAALATVGLLNPGRRSQGDRIPRDPPMLILDTYGELGSVYALADLAVVGGGFAQLGGQNILQPLALGVPVIHGPHMSNFRDIASMADRAGATVTCSTPSEVATSIRQLLADADQRRQMSSAAQELVAANRGASLRYATAILAALHQTKA